MLALLLFLVQTASAGPFDAELAECWATAPVDASAAIGLADATLPKAAREGAAGAVAELRLCRGYAQQTAHRLDSAEADYAFTVAEATRLHDDKLLADALVVRGELRHERAQFGSALEDLQRAYRLNAGLGRNAKVRYALNAIANVYADVGVADYDRALEYYGQVLAENEKAGLKAEIATDHFNIGATLEKKGELPKALEHLRTALALDGEIGDTGQRAYCERQIAILLTKLGRPSDALSYADAALAAFESTEDAEMVAATRLTRGIARSRLGLSSAALSDLDAAREHFAAAGSDRFLEKIEEERATALAAAQRWAAAYEARTAHLRVAQRLGEESRRKHVANLRVEFDSERKEAQNRALQRENALQARVLLLAAACLLLALYVVVRKLVDARRLRLLAMTDELTRLPNRRHLLLVAADAFAASRASGNAFSVLALDVDRFKSINDRFGHAAGDLVLQRVTHACRATLRPKDRIGRIGGEEFAVVLPGTAAPEAGEIGERLRRAVEGRDFSDVAAGLVVTISGGHAQREGSDADFAAMLHRADEALYRAKQAGRNRIEAAGPRPANR